MQDRIELIADKPVDQCDVAVDEAAQTIVQRRADTRTCTEQSRPEPFEQTVETAAQELSQPMSDPDRIRPGEAALEDGLTQADGVAIKPGSGLDMSQDDS